MITGSRHSSDAPVLTPLSGLQTIEETAGAVSVKTAPNEEMTVLLVADPRLLEDHTKAWDDLSASALEPNVFYESWMMLPALRKFGSERIRIALVYARDKARPNGPKVLCGLFPLELQSRYKGLPLKVLRLWQHTYCCLCTPLVRADCASEVLSAFFNWLETESREPSLIEFQSVSADGPFHHALTDALNQRAALSFVSDLHTRALLRPDADSDSYLRRAMSREHRKDVRRKERHIAELGEVEYSILDESEDLAQWIEEFLHLERRGWKGRNRSAMDCSEESREYFTEIVTEAFRRDKLMMMALRLDHQAIAMKCNFRAGSGAFAFKIAFDETHARRSPGLLLEVENIRRLHHQPSIEWMDSCARSNHPMVNRLWTDRRAIQTMLISSGRAPGDLAVSLMPLVRWFHRKMKKGGRIDHKTEVNEL